MRKALVIGPNRIGDAGDVLAVARAEGKRALRTPNIRIPPEANLPRDEKGNYIIIIEPLDDLAHNSPGAGDKRTRE